MAHQYQRPIEIQKLKSMQINLFSNIRYMSAN